MPSSEHDPSLGNTDGYYERQPDPNRATRDALATFLDVVHALANNMPDGHLQGAIERGVACFRTAATDNDVSPEQETRAAFALTVASFMATGFAQFPGMMWVREPFRREIRRLQNNGSPVIIRPIGMARKADFAIIAMPGVNRNEGWRLYRREQGETQGGYDVVELLPDSNGLIHLGSDDTQTGVYGYTTLTGRHTTDAYAAYIGEHHTTVDTAPGDLVVHDHSFAGTSVEYVINGL